MCCSAPPRSSTFPVLWVTDASGCGRWLGSGREGRAAVGGVVGCRGQSLQVGCKPERRLGRMHERPVGRVIRRDRTELQRVDVPDLAVLTVAPRHSDLALGVFNPAVFAVDTVLPIRVSFPYRFTVVTRTRAQAFGSVRKADASCRAAVAKAEAVSAAVATL